MNVTVTGRHLDVGQALRQHVESGLEAVVSKYFDNAIEASVTFDKESPFYTVDIMVHVGRGMLIKGEEQADDPYVAFNAAAEHIAKRLRRYKRRLRDHHQGEAREVEALKAQQYILAHEDDEAAESETAVENRARGRGAEGDGQGVPVIVAEMTTDITTLTVQEAVMRLDLANAPALMFRNAAHGGLNMIYRRPDGNIGWVDPRGTRERTR